MSFRANKQTNCTCILLARYILLSSCLIRYKHILHYCSCVCIQFNCHEIKSLAMNYLLLIFTLAIPCLAVQPNQQSSSDEEPGILVSSIARWLDLHRKLYDNNTPATSAETINLQQLKPILDEMYSIEQTEAFKIGMVDDLLEHNTSYNKYQHLLFKSYEMNLSIDKNITITQLLLSLFNYNSNDCSEEYYDYLEDIAQAFVDSPISLASKQLRDLQHQNCWLRLINSANATCMLLGSTIKNSLDRLVGLIYPMPCEIIVPSIESTEIAHEIETNRFSQIIANFLLNYNKGDMAQPALISIDLGLDFQIHIEQPCRFLVLKTKHIMMEIYGLLSHIEKRTNFMKDNDINMVNRYMMCDRILANYDAISKQITNFLPNDRILDANLSTQHVDNRNANQDQGTDLITQYLAFELDAPEQLPAITTTTTNSPKDKFVDTTTRDNEILEYGSNLADIHGENNDFISQYLLLDAENHVATEGASSAQLNTVEQNKNASSGDNETVNLITQHLLQDSENLNEQEASQTESDSGSKKEAAAKGPKILESSEKQVKKRKVKAKPPIARDPNSETKFVVNILAGKGRGKWILYPTIWSDGSQTMERKEKLLEDWPVEWHYFNNARRSVKQRSFYARKIAKNPKSVRRYRKSKYEMTYQEYQSMGECSGQFKFSPTKPLPPDPIANNRFVVSIGRSLGRGTYAKYPVTWSDGSKSLECKNYLINYWEAAWKEMDREAKAYRQRKYIENKKKG